MPPTVTKILDRFQRLSDPKQRYEQLILYGQKLPPFNEADKVPDNRVSGCVSQVYVTATLDEAGRIQFQGDSDALISKGFVGLLATAFNGLTIDEIREIDASFIEATGLVASLTPSRANGFYNILKTMQSKALHLTIGQN
jgi:cysteine desulfuration protein SufE